MADQDKTRVEGYNLGNISQLRDLAPSVYGPAYTAYKYGGLPEEMLQRMDLLNAAYKSGASPFENMEMAAAPVMSKMIGKGLAKAAPVMSKMIGKGLAKASGRVGGPVSYEMYRVKDPVKFIAMKNWNGPNPPQYELEKAEEIFKNLLNHGYVKRGADGTFTSTVAGEVAADKTDKMFSKGLYSKTGTNPSGEGFVSAVSGAMEGPSAKQNFMRTNSRADLEDAMQDGDSDYWTMFESMFGTR